MFGKLLRKPTVVRPAARPVPALRPRLEVMEDRLNPDGGLDYFDVLLKKPSSVPTNVGEVLKYEVK